MAVSYTCVLLNEPDRDALLVAAGVHENERMAGWEIKAHHMTICLKKSENPDVLDMIGSVVTLKVVAFGSLFLEGNTGIAAVKVEPPESLPVDNKTPHITMAHAKGVKPKQSNDIAEWVALPEPFFVSGIVTEVEYKQPTAV